MGRKILIFALAALCALSLSSCMPNASPPVQTEQPTPSRSPEPENIYTLGFSQIGAENDWRTSCTDSIRESFESIGWKCSFSDARGSQDKQWDDIRDMIKSGVDVIAFTPVSSAGWESILKECEQAGIYTICVDKTIAAGNSEYSAYVGSDQEALGSRIAQWLKYYMARKSHAEASEQSAQTTDPLETPSEEPIVSTSAPARSPEPSPTSNANESRSLRILELSGIQSNRVTTERHSGFSSVANHEGWKIINTLYGKNTRYDAKIAIEEFLKGQDEKNKENESQNKKAELSFDVLFSHDDEMAIGSIEALEEAGIIPGKDVIVVSIGGSRFALDEIVTGKLNATAQCSPFLGPQVAQLAIKLTKGEDVQKVSRPYERVFDASNAARARELVLE